MIFTVVESACSSKYLLSVIEFVKISENPFPLSQYQRSEQATIDRFRDILYAAGLNTITRRTRGEDIDAACGQLAGKIKDRTKRRERFLKQRSLANLSAPLVSTLSDETKPSSAQKGVTPQDTSTC